ncbi:MAG TPA: SRPBCC domain-containing protein [Longimicrobiales bacterium]|nr:SRPBCC domain-containing protein [Longimicrobiales bacterium]
MAVVADVTVGVIRGDVEIAASPGRVLQALTDPVELEQWWGADDMYRTFDWRIDLRPGGAWSCQARNAGGEGSSVRGRYVTVDPPRVLEYTWQPSWDDFAETLVRLELEPTDAGTRLRVTHTGFGDRADSCNGHAQGWTVVTGWLSEHAGMHP